MPFTHQKTVTVVPADDPYSWNNGAPSWVTITQDGNTDTWNFLVDDNNTGSQRQAIMTVNHSDGNTSASFQITQNPLPASDPVPAYSSFTVFQTQDGTSTDVNEGAGPTGNATFRITGTDIPDGCQIAVTGIQVLDSNGAPGTGDIADFDVTSSSMLSNTATDLTSGSGSFEPFEFLNNVAELDLQVVADNVTEGNETYRVTISADVTDGSGVIGQHGLTSTIDFIINDTSIYTPALMYYGSLGNPGLLGSAQASTASNGDILSTYTWDNNTTPLGPVHTIIVDTFNDIPPVIISGSGAVTTAGAVYWSNSADGSTNDTTSIVGSGANAVVHNFNISANFASNGQDSGNASLSWEDGQGASATTSSPPAGLGETPAG